MIQYLSDQSGHKSLIRVIALERFPDEVRNVKRTQMYFAALIFNEYIILRDLHYITTYTNSFRYSSWLGLVP